MMADDPDAIAFARKLFGEARELAEAEKQSAPQPAPEQQPEQEPAQFTDALPPGIGRLDLEAEARKAEAARQAGPKLPPGDKEFSDYTAADWEASHAYYRAQAADRQAKADAEQRASRSQEEALLQDVERFTAQGNVAAASLAANQLRQVQRTAALFGGEVRASGGPTLEEQVAQRERAARELSKYERDQS